MSGFGLLLLFLSALALLLLVDIRPKLVRVLNRFTLLVNAVVPKLGFVGGFGEYLNELVLR